MVADAGARQVDFDVFDLFVGMAGGNLLPHGKAGGKRLLFRVYRSAPFRFRFGRAVAGRGSGGCGGQTRHGFGNGGRPLVGLRLIFQIANTDLVQPLAAEFSQQQIEIASGLAEFRITRIAQAQYGKADCAQIGGFFAVEEFMQRQGLFRRLALALGGRYQQ